MKDTNTEYYQRLLNERKKAERTNGVSVIHECSNSEYAKKEYWMPLLDAPNIFISSYGRMIRENKRDGKRIILTDQPNFKSQGVVMIKGKYVRPHVLTAQYFGALGKGDRVKHINRDRDDNIIDNLRFGSKSEVSRPSRKSREYTTQVSLAQFTLTGVFVRCWNNIYDVVENTGCRKGDILMCAEGEVLSAFGYIWTFNTGDPEYRIYPRMEEKVYKLEPLLIKAIYNNAQYLFPTVSDASAISGISELDIVKAYTSKESKDDWNFSCESE